MYFFDPMSSSYSSFHVWACDVDIKDGAALFTEEMMMESMFEDMFSVPQMRMSEDDFKRMASNPNAKVYGVSVRIGPDGKPIIREFGNIKPENMEVKAETGEEPDREPLVDVFQSKDSKKITVIAEIPGVDKDSIRLDTTEDKLTIKTTDKAHKYYKEIELPGKVDPDSAKAVYKNGVLTLEFDAKPEATGRKKKIQVE